MTVLLLARDLNPSADHLVRTLTERGVPMFRTDLAAFPQTLSLDARLGPSGWEGVLATEHRELRLQDIRSVWYRHPSHFVLPEGMSPTERRHAAAEARCGLSGVLSSLDDVLWVNHPARESDAVKPRQLDVARRCGLSVPDSQVTNRPEGVRGFARDLSGALVCKTWGGALRAESGRLQMAYTHRLDRVELDDLAGVDTTLHFFQPFVPKLFEARVTVVGDRIFAAAIHAKSDSTRVDWRADYDALDYSIIEPPESVTAGMLAFLRVLGLSFGAFDFAITPSGDWSATRPVSTGGWRRPWGCRSPRRWPTCWRRELDGAQRGNEADPRGAGLRAVPAGSAGRAVHRGRDAA